MYSTTNKLYVMYSKQTVCTVQQAQTVRNIQQRNSMKCTSGNCMYCTTNKVYVL